MNTDSEILALAVQLNNRHVEMICFTTNQAFIHFEGKAFLQLEGEIDCKLGTTIEKYFNDESPKATILTNALENRVTSVSVTSSRNLDIKFSGGLEIEVFADLNYESYQIVIGNEKVIV